jgi:aminomethyltransferase
MPVGTPFHPRTAALNRSGHWRDWSGCFAAGSYAVDPEREYNAIRQAAALIDVSPLYKYRVSGRDATRLVDRVVTRDAGALKIGQVAYTHWCDAAGKVIDDGTLSRLGHDVYRWTAAEPSLRWIHLNAHGLDVRIEDVSDSTAALALQGPTSRDVLRACAEGDVERLRYFRVARAHIAGVPVEISRTGYTGDLGYEVWIPAERALEVWDALVAAGRDHGLAPTGILALDVARIEAGLILLDVDYTSARKALVEAQKSTPYEIGLGRLVQLDKGPFVGRAALRRAAQAGPATQLMGLEVEWGDVEQLHAEVGLSPHLPFAASRLSAPVYREGLQVGKATSSTWSPILKKMIALATLASDVAAPGTRLSLEFTVEHRRRDVGVRVVPLPFFDPPRKRA